MAYTDTPGAEAGNLTSTTTGFCIDDISAENTFLSPSKKEPDLVSQMRNHRGVNLKTPRSRAPFGDRRNLPVAPGQGEFTPLLKSVAKKNLQRAGRQNGGPDTPDFLKKGYKGAPSPALPARSLGGYSENTGSSVGTSDDGTPVPPVASSSAQATPLAILPKRNAEGVLVEQGNVLTLREQENVRVTEEHFTSDTDITPDHQQDREGELWPQTQNPLPRGVTPQIWTWTQCSGLEREHRSEGG